MVKKPPKGRHGAAPRINPTDPRLISSDGISIPSNVFLIDKIYSSHSFRFQTSNDILDFIKFANENPHVIGGVTYCEPDMEQPYRDYDSTTYAGSFTIHFTYDETEELAINRINDYIRRAIAEKEEWEKKALKDAARREKKEKEQLLRLANKYGINIPSTLKE